MSASVDQWTNGGGFEALVRAALAADPGATRGSGVVVLLSLVVVLALLVSDWLLEEADAHIWRNSMMKSTRRARRPTKCNGNMMINCE